MGSKASESMEARSKVGVSCKRMVLDQNEERDFIRGKEGCVWVLHLKDGEAMCFFVDDVVISSEFVDDEEPSSPILSRSSSPSISPPSPSPSAKSSTTIPLSILRRRSHSHTSTSTRTTRTLRTQSTSTIATSFSSLSSFPSPERLRGGRWKA